MNCVPRLLWRPVRDVRGAAFQCFKGPGGDFGRGGLPDGAFVQDDQGYPTMTFNPQSGLYRDWLRDNSGTRQTVVDAYQTAYGVVIDR